jgi:hypothetical protein
MKVTQSQVNGWLKDPVTQAFIEATNLIRDDLIYKCGSGGCKSQTESIDKLYSHYQGSISVASLFCAPELIIDNYGLIHKEADKEESTHD